MERKEESAMVKHKEHFHGSDLEKIEAVYGIKKEDITSFSANVNPLGISPKMRATLIDKIDCITSYPDREYTALRRCIADYTGTSAEHIVVGNGSTELISLFIQLVHPKKAMILGPTYSEYERELKLTGGVIVNYSLKEEDSFILNIPGVSYNYLYYPSEYHFFSVSFSVPMETINKRISFLPCLYGQS